MADNWKQVGEIPVDTGTILIADPCHVIPDSDWDDWHMEISEAGLWKNETMMRANTGHVPHTFVSTTGVGDGSYPVEARFTEDGRVAELRVRFLEDDGRQPGMLTEAEAKAIRDRDRKRVLAADRANKKRYGKK
jgi:hypothetical protein